jgi:phospholipid/cholesterol/gamma-HCH transport system substrate-binding protein
VKVWFTVNETYADRIRTDSEATIRTMGLLGDRYLEIRGGSSSAALIPENGEVRGINQPELEEFMSGGEDVMENVLSISSSLRVILRRVEQGEGLLGQMTMGPAGGEEGISHLTRDTLTSLDEILGRVKAGKGLLGRLLYDEAFAQDVEASMRSLRDASGALSGDLERDDSAYAVLMRNPDTARLLRQSVLALHDGSQALAAATQELASGKGTLPRLLSDHDYADHFLDDLLALVANLRSIATKLDDGQGSLGELINDPRLYDDLENVVRGVEHSKVVSWFVRNRRRAGEKLEHEEEEGAKGPSTP